MVEVIYQAEIPHVMLFFVKYLCKLIIFQFWTVGLTKKKQPEDVTLEIVMGFFVEILQNQKTQIILSCI